VDTQRNRDPDTRYRHHTVRQHTSGVQRPLQSRANAWWATIGALLPSLSEQMHEKV
jgi:hypothetical protein